MNQKENSGTRKLPDILSYQEQKMLLAQPNPKAPTGLRNLCILRVMLNAGLRLSEVIHLTPSVLNLETGELNVLRSTGENGRTLWLGQEDRQVISKWYQIKPDSKFLFCTLKGDVLKDRYVREMVKRLGRKAGIEKNIFPHTLRHTFAADLYSKTKDIRIVQKALGHADLSTTMIYTYIINNELESALSDFIQERQFTETKSSNSLTTENRKEQDVPLLSKPTIDHIISKKRKYSIHAIKCKCGEVIGRQMEKCPGCRESIEDSLEKLKRDFHRVNFGIQETQQDT